MGNCCSHKIECVHTLDMLESERLKVAALNLFHPTASPLFEKVRFFIIPTQSLRGEGWDDGDRRFMVHPHRPAP